MRPRSTPFLNDVVLYVIQYTIPYTNSLAVRITSTSDMIAHYVLHITQVIQRYSMYLVLTY